MSRFRSTTRALRHRNFRLFFVGQIISLIGTWMQTVAQSWLVYRLTGSSALLGLVNFASPARQTFLVEMTSREDLINAIALNSSAFNGARIAGPAMAGILVALVGEGWCFSVNAVSYIAVIAGLLMMDVPRAKPRHIEA